MVFQLLGIGSAILAIYLGITRAPLKGLGGAAITGLAALSAVLAMIDLSDRRSVGEAALSSVKFFALMFAILGFWYGLGLLLNWGWRKLTDAS
jgi:hypothetical protein